MASFSPPSVPPDCYPLEPVGCLDNPRTLLPHCLQPGVHAAFQSRGQAVGRCLWNSEKCEALAPRRETPSTSLPWAGTPFGEGWLFSKEFTSALTPDQEQHRVPILQVKKKLSDFSYHPLQAPPHSPRPHLMLKCWLACWALWKKTFPPLRILVPKFHQLPLLRMKNPSVSHSVSFPLEHRCSIEIRCKPQMKVASVLILSSSHFFKKRKVTFMLMIPFI